jgi:hypothetical protein
VLRDHTHTDFNTSQPIPGKTALVSPLKAGYEIKSILLLHDPIDSYTSLVKNGWGHFEPQTVGEYCLRLLLLIESLCPEQIVK